MTDAGDILLSNLQENWAQARQSEDQRATITNIVIGIASFIHALLSQVGFTVHAVPITVFMVVLGIYGFVASTKLYERHQYHTQRARHIRQRLEELYPEANISQLLRESRAEHRQEFPRVEAIRLNRIWLFLHILIASLGAIYSVLILL